MSVVGQFRRILRLWLILIECIAFIVIISSEHTYAQEEWKHDVLVSYRNGDIRSPKMIKDGTGGYYIVWYDYYFGKSYINRLDHSGKKLWKDYEKPANTPFDKLVPDVVADGAGGAIVVWAENRDGYCEVRNAGRCDVYGQRFNRDGDMLWGDEGRVVAKGPGNWADSGVSLISDGKGGAIVAWQGSQVRVQRITGDGNILWGPEGRIVSNENPKYFQFNPFRHPLIVGDGRGGAFAAWLAEGDTRARLRVRHVDAEGKFAWAPKIVAEPSKTFFNMSEDGKGGAIFSYSVYGDGIHQHVLQRTDRNGVKLWKEGVITGKLRGYVYPGDLIPDRAGGVFVAWWNYVYSYQINNKRIYVQHTSSDGVNLWGSEGKLLSDEKSSFAFPPKIFKLSGLNELFIVWPDCRFTHDIGECWRNSNIYGQIVSTSGVIRGPIGGLPVSLARGAQGFIRYDVPSSIAGVPDVGGTVTLAWPDGRLGPCSYGSIGFCTLYARKIAVPR